MTLANVRFWHKADIPTRLLFCPLSGQSGQWSRENENRPLGTPPGGLLLVSTRDSFAISSSACLVAATDPKR
jgi:hypothetical protein